MCLVQYVHAESKTMILVTGPSITKKGPICYQNKSNLCAIKGLLRDLCNIRSVLLITIISYNSMPTFNYKCVLLICYNPDNISKKKHLVRGVSSLNTVNSIRIWTWKFGSDRQT